MTNPRYVRILPLALAASLVGCAHAKVQKELLADVKKVGLLSVTVDRIGEAPSDFEVMEQGASFAAEEYARLLGGSRWQLVPAREYQQHPAFVGFQDLAQSPLVRAQLQKMMEQGKLKPADMQTAMRYMKAQLSGNKEEMQRALEESIPAAARQLEGILQQKRQAYVAARGLAFIPYEAVKPEGAGNTTKVTITNGQQQQSPEEALRDLLFATIGALATELGLDALAIVHQRAAVTSTVGVGVLVGDRGLDTLRMGSTVLFITKDGKKAVDMGYPSMDALAHSRMAVPVYRRKGEHGRELDLKDPKGKVLEELKSLTTEAAGGLVKDLELELAKN